MSDRRTTPSVIRLGPAQEPKVDPSTWLAPGAVVVGDVNLSEDVSVWYNTVIRADAAPVFIGARSNIQDGCAIHADPGFPVNIGSDVSVGHNAVIHGARVGHGSLIGMGAIVLNGSDIGAGSLVAAGTVVLEGTQVPAGSLVAGVPGKVRRPLSDDERSGIARNASIYLGLRDLHSQSDR